METFRNEEIDAVYLLYNEFKSVMAQRLTVARVLPMELPEQGGPDRLSFSSSRPPSCWPRCCPGTSKRSFTARCWNPPPPSTPRA